MGEFWDDIPLFASTDEVPKFEKDSKVPDDVQDSIAMLSHLIHDDESPDERAELLRDQGNRYFKIGTRSALHGANEKYAAAIAIEGANVEIRSLTYLNRAAAHIKLQNYGHAINDAKMAAKLDSSNGKAYWRAALAANKVGRWKEAQTFASSGLIMMKAGSVSKRFLELELDRARQGLQRDKAREEAVTRRKESRIEQEKTMKDVLLAKNVRIGPPLFSQQLQYSIKEPMIDENGATAYPVLFVYPQLEEDFPVQSDYIEAFHEDDCIGDYLKELLPPPWDSAQQFVPGRIDVLYRSRWTISPDEAAQMAAAGQEIEKDYVGSSRGVDELGDWVTAPTDQPLHKILRRSSYIVPMFPVFFIVPCGYRPPVLG
eukprot:Plantae.Rhodophyta-Purpureofilum_apyrenoidigerum.ctg40505.p1 GENE.Plantae.Rhodophyta-Purpureofilum_apyrenoidigerum.ctg40505~~Plantae.Rhodophyta-Purpureofilum_apyrenoidigerum.ctg40505.p1  ORF type:complete len:395 (-),score=73.52 Plantae.Rhodophyta-Purpureofilum_apyrenoidigerum.ctg40505:77-1192(-)